MSSISLSASHQRLVMGGLPALVGAVAIFLIVPRAAQLQRLERETKALQQAVASLPPLPPGPVAGSAEEAAPGAASPSRDEQLIFLEDLTRLMKKGRVRLLSYRPPDAQTSPEGAAQGGALFVPRATEITVEGTYGCLISFFHELKRTRRILATESLHVAATRYPRLAATFRLSRYVVRDTPPSP